MRALLAPFPDLKLVPTGGVSAENLGDWYAAGAFALGAGGDLCSNTMIAGGDFDGVTANARRYRERPRRARGTLMPERPSPSTGSPPAASPDHADLPALGRAPRPRRTSGSTAPICPSTPTRRSTATASGASRRTTPSSARWSPRTRSTSSRLPRPVRRARPPRRAVRGDVVPVQARRPAARARQGPDLGRAVARRHARARLLGADTGARCCASAPTKTDGRSSHA